MNETTKQCSTTGSCPFSFTDKSEIIQNYGCLPTPYQILKMRTKYNKTWACHCNPTKPCLGALNYLKDKKLPYEVVDNELLTEDSDWILYIK